MFLYLLSTQGILSLCQVPKVVEQKEKRDGKPGQPVATL